MFPTLDYLINYIFGTSLTWNFPPSFGTMVAIAFLAAAWVLSRELKRKEKLGLLKPTYKKEKVGEPASMPEIAINALIGFVIGWKIIGAIIDRDAFGADAQGYIVSGQGNIFAGLAVAAVFGYLKYREKEKKRLPEPKEELVEVHPFQLTGTITMAAAIWGIIGAKIFHQLEYWDQFMADPMGSLTSTSGLTFYGGLIGGVFGVWRVTRKHKMPLIHVADAVAPGLILAYAVGRIGCMISGDGDWGVINSAYRINEEVVYTVVPPDSIQGDLAQYYAIYAESPEMVDYIYYEKPSWLGFLPNWMFAFDFRHNVNEEGIPMSGCEGKYCNRLPLPTFPTAFYETCMGLLIFLILWMIRKRIAIPGFLFSVYLIFNGIERFLIEQIRVNSTLPLFGMQVTQAEIIAVVLILIGIAGLFLTRRFQQAILKA